ncbi:MAG: ketoacyl-ACP synthase III [Chloroflexi bacterium]|nr:ketoacyl-ACP synthase III [Chloroflexota bacterium]
MSQRARIVGVGRYLPDRIMTNEDLAQLVETSDEWITERTGIRERRIAADDETTSGLAAQAAIRALRSAGIDASAVDLIITGTCTPDGMFPAVSTLVQHAIGAPDSAAFDVNAACNGFLSALSTATQFIATGQSKHALVIGAEITSRIVDWTDRSTCVLFGDGAGAVVLEAAVDGEPGSVDSLVLHSDGSQSGVLYATGPCTPGYALAQEARVFMNGAAVFKQAVTAMSDACVEVLSRSGLEADDIQLVVPHQANSRIITAVAERLGVSSDRVYMNVDRYGNTSSATIPIALAEAAAEGRLRPGDRVLLTAFGGGLSWGAMTLEWGTILEPTGATMPQPAAALRPTSEVAGASTARIHS